MSQYTQTAIHKLVKISNNTVPGLILPEIVYNVKRKKGCIFIENHNSVSSDLQRGETIGVVTQEDLGQQSENRKENRQSVTGRSKSTITCIGSASVENTEKVEKAGQKVEWVQTIENRQSYKTEEEK